jgi:hypothetical protein
LPELLYRSQHLVEPDVQRLADPPGGRHDAFPFGGCDETWARSPSPVC